jgi:hypothetical protein
MLLLAVDANFRLKNRMRVNEIDDPSLGPGWGYWVEPKAYHRHVKKYVNEKDVRIFTYLYSIPSLRDCDADGKSEQHMHRIRSSPSERYKDDDGAQGIGGGRQCVRPTRVYEAQRVGRSAEGGEVSFCFRHHLSILMHQGTPTWTTSSWRPFWNSVCSC